MKDFFIKAMLLIFAFALGIIIFAKEKENKMDTVPDITSIYYNYENGDLEICTATGDVYLYEDVQMETEEFNVNN